MNAEEKRFVDYLKHFNAVASNLASLLALAERMEEQKDWAKNELLNSMKKEIAVSCSTEFVGQMKTGVSRELKNLNLFGLGPKTNLDYLVEVMFMSLTSSSYVIGYQHFIAPGKNYEESCEFCGKFFEDFILVKRLFGLEAREVPEVKVGCAWEFYKP